ncbi:MAG: hypothetical protein R3260_00585 [Pseudomonas sp.]|nr:hypothetical protein [Pseudomonas sp.]
MPPRNDQPDITVQQVLDVFRYYDAASLKSQQAKLSGAASQLEKFISGPLKAFLSDEEISQVKSVSQLIRSMNSRVEHAKEIKRREEQKRERELKAAQNRVTLALKELIPTPQAAPGAALEITKLLIALHREKFVLDFLMPSELCKNVSHRLDLALADKSKGVEWFNRYVHDEIVTGLKDYMQYREKGNAKAEIQALLDTADLGIEIVVPAYKKVLENVQNQVAIEQGHNIERLPVKPQRRR